MNKNSAPGAQPDRAGQRKLFFGLFIFPLVIAVGMAVILCTVVLFTHEEETPETLIAAIKTGSPSKRWQKAFELSNEINRNRDAIRNQGVMREIAHILSDPAHYDAKTRGYMAIALSHFQDPEAAEALGKALKDESEDVQLYAIWALGVSGAKSHAGEIRAFLASRNDEIRKTAVYVLGVLGDNQAVAAIKPLLDDASPDLRWNAALSLARLGDDSGRDVLLKMAERESLEAEYQLNEEQIEKVMVNAVKGLALVGGASSREVLESLSRRDKSLKVRQAALEAIQYHDNGQKNVPAQSGLS